MNEQNRLSALENKKQSANVQPYSSFIKRIKIILPLCMVAIIGLLIIWPTISDIETTPLTRDDLNALQEAQSENRLLNPVFNTLDAEGRPVSITAKEARQKREDQERLYLYNPAAEFDADGNILYLEARDGEYDQKQKTLTLSGSVVIKDSQNNVLTTNKLITSIPDGIAKSDQKAKLTTNRAVIEGQAVIIDHKNQTTTFQGPAKAVITK